MTIRSAITDLSGGVIRLSDVENPEYGDDFVYSIPFRFVAHDVIEFIGVSKERESLPPSAWRVLMNECDRLGAKQVTYVRRRKDGTVAKRFIRIRKVPQVVEQIADDTVVRCHVRLVRRVLHLCGCLHFSKRRDAADPRVGE